MPDDTRWMRRALALADEGATFASPNPTVGCVLVRDGATVGEGFHEYAHRDHAEIVALRHAGERARGATAYVTLEPCRHHGRTPPCADALIAAGVARVVVATQDPNPLVSGRGIAQLRDAGIQVTVGVLQRAARAHNNAFAKWITCGVPFVTLKSAVSADGKIAPKPGAFAPGERFHLTGYVAGERVQQMRAESDALLTGLGTVLADDPLLTDRSGRARRRPLLRCVVDSHLRTPIESRLVQSAQNDVVLFCVHADKQKMLELRKRGVEGIELPESHGGVSLQSVLRVLAARSTTSVLLEAGSALNTAMLRDGLVDAMALFSTRHSIGADGIPMAAIPPPHPEETQSTQLGPDRLEYSLLRDPWASLG